MPDAPAAAASPEEALFDAIMDPANESPDIGDADPPADPGAPPPEQSAEPERAEPEAASPEEPETPAEGDPEPAQEDMVEWEGEDGKTVSVALSDLVEAYQKRNERAPVDEAAVRESVRAEIEQQVAADRQALVQQRADYLDKMKWALSLLGPGKKPDRAMLNPSSDKYDPDKYHAQLASWEARAEWFEKVVRDYQADVYKHAQEAEQRAVNERRTEAQKLVKAWPELQRPEERTRIRGQMVEVLGQYGYTEQEVDSIVDHRQFKVVRDLLAYHAMKSTKGVEAVKRKAAPKLVKAAARTADAGANGRMPPQTRAMLDARKEVKRTGRVTPENAEAFLGDIIFGN